MNHILTLLQIIEILVKWTYAIVRNYQITAWTLLIFDIISRIDSGKYKPISFWELFLISLLVIFYYKKHSKPKKINKTIYIENKNLIEIYNKPKENTDNK